MTIAQELKDKRRLELQSPKTPPEIKASMLKECLQEALPACLIEVKAVPQPPPTLALYKVRTTLLVGKGPDLQVDYEISGYYLIHAEYPVDRIAGTIAHRLGNELVRELDL